MKLVTNGGSGRPHPARTGNFEESMVGLPSGGVTCGEHAEHAEHAVCSDAAEVVATLSKSRSLVSRRRMMSQKYEIRFFNNGT